LQRPWQSKIIQGRGAQIIHQAAHVEHRFVRLGFGRAQQGLGFLRIGRYQLGNGFQPQRLAGKLARYRANRAAAPPFIFSSGDDT
jgi:hypothetical protein